ncbi:hypothetical protein CALVIDRAFT_569061 [Calocera viscosa TUFC12733]|uniref:Uncharacterized protein n=1 Tax=Calocera viscosa (strain TUFC12733) TaxID=1330018 RepID=A0A167GCK1_CALVF|nr:hypothetical protein CALVIDRAFT_569061 [Calocera viscosa TUFC12733]
MDTTTQPLPPTIHPSNPSNHHATSQSTTSSPPAITPVSEPRTIVFLPILAVPHGTSLRIRRILFNLFLHLYMTSDDLTSDFLNQFTAGPDQIVAIEDIAMRVVQQEQDCEQRSIQNDAEHLVTEPTYKRHLLLIRAAIQNRQARRMGRPSTSSSSYADQPPQPLHRVFVPLLPIPHLTSDRIGHILFLLFQHIYNSDDDLTSDFLSQFQSAPAQLIVIEKIAQHVIKEEQCYEQLCRDKADIPFGPEHRYRVPASLSVFLSFFNGRLLASVSIPSQFQLRARLR